MAYTVYTKTGTDAAIAAQAAADSATYAPLSGVALAFNVNSYGAGSGQSSAANKTAIQAAISAAQSLTKGRGIVRFPDASYSVDAGLTVTRSSIEFEGGYGGTDAGDGTSFTALNFNFAAIGGTGTAISIGTDDGQAYDANDYSGHENTQFRRLTLTYAGGATTETPLLNTPGISYGAGCYGIRDWRGGSMINEDLNFVGFERGFWGVVSDLNIWRRCAASNCSVGYYLDARSDQNSFYDFFPYGNDSAITVDGAHQTRFYGASFVGNGSASTSAVNLRASYARGNIGTVFDSCYFEQLQRAAVVDSWFSIGGFGSYPVTGVRIINPIFFTNGSGGATHVKYLATLNNCDDIVLENPTGNFGVPVDYWFHLPSGFSYSPHITARITQPFNAVAMYLNDGTGAPLFTEYVAGNGDHILRSANPRLRMVSEPAQPERDWFIDAPANDRWVVQQPGRSDGNGLFLDFRRRVLHGGAAPSSGAYQAGDLVINQSATAGSTFGWRCTVSGSPGTWETLTFSAGGSGSGSPLARTFYRPTTAATYSITGTTTTVVDATNLTVTFTATTTAASATLEGFISGSNRVTDVVNPGDYYWALVDSTNTLVPNTSTYVYGDNSSARIRATIDVTGLTVGQSYTWRWAFGCRTATHTQYIYAGGIYGSALMQVDAR